MSKFIQKLLNKEVNLFQVYWCLLYYYLQWRVKPISPSKKTHYQSTTSRFLQIMSRGSLCQYARQTRYSHVVHHIFYNLTRYYRQHTYFMCFSSEMISFLQSDPIAHLFSSSPKITKAELTSLTFSISIGTLISLVTTCTLLSVHKQDGKADCRRKSY